MTLGHFRLTNFSTERIDPDELVNGELSPTSIKKFSFSREIADSPSVNRSDFSSPFDVLHVLCAGKDAAEWSIFFRVDRLPQAITSGTIARFAFFPNGLWDRPASRIF
jgi:hypothetical protein